MFAFFFFFQFTHRNQNTVIPTGISCDSVTRTFTLLIYQNRLNTDLYLFKSHIQVIMTEYVVMHLIFVKNVSSNRRKWRTIYFCNNQHSNPDDLPKRSQSGNKRRDIDLVIKASLSSVLKTMSNLFLSAPIPLSLGNMWFTSMFNWCFYCCVNQSSCIGRPLDVLKPVGLSSTKF